MLEIDFQQIEFLDKKEQQELLDKITEVIQYAFYQEKQVSAKNWEMSIIFTDNQSIQEINKMYRDKNQATDVISFAFNDVDDGILFDEAIPQILGEIFISVERAHEQAIEYHHSFEREMCFLALHGFLHLLGYDHMNEVDEKKMFAVQNDVLDALKIYR